MTKRVYYGIVDKSSIVKLPVYSLSVGEYKSKKGGDDCFIDKRG